MGENFAIGPGHLYIRDESGHMVMMLHCTNADLNVDAGLKLPKKIYTHPYVPPMSRKRFIKLVMGHGVSRNAARVLAERVRKPGLNYRAAYEYLLIAVSRGELRWR